MAIADARGPFGGAVDGPYVDGFAVTPSDTVNFSNVASALWVGTAGATPTLAVVMQSGTVVTFNNVASGTLLRVRCIRVNSTGTLNMSNIVGLF